MAPRIRRMFSTASILAAVSVLSACATTYDSAGNRYFSVWPFIGSRNPELQLNYPVQDPSRLQLGRDPDPWYWISPQPPIDNRVTSPYSQAPTDPDAGMCCAWPCATAIWELAPRASRERSALKMQHKMML